MQFKTLITHKYYMPTKIRLQRFGKKGQPFYRIVIADSRAPRDGRFIENIGSYNPLTNPASININFERALYWLQTGAQPTNTAKAIFSYKGVLYKNHLQKGILKGALTQEQADVKFNEWLTEKEKKIQLKIKENERAKKEINKQKLLHEEKVNEERKKSIQKKHAKAEAQLLSDETKENAETLIQEIAEPKEVITTEGLTETTEAAETSESTEVVAEPPAAEPTEAEEEVFPEEPYVDETEADKKEE